jgi:hypothetical protein
MNHEKSVWAISTYVFGERKNTEKKKLIYSTTILLLPILPRRRLLLPILLPHQTFSLDTSFTFLVHTAHPSEYDKPCHSSFVERPVLSNVVIAGLREFLSQL